jgi:hypothetical protein
MPSTTIIAQPGQLMPAYNPIKYIIDNTNKNEPGFRYIFTIYPAAGSHIPANVVAQYRVLPAWSTGYGEQDISLLMQSLVTYNESGLYSTIPYNSSESWYQYDVDLGFEYIDNIDYTLALQESGGGDVEIHFAAHGFVLGDQVVIAQTGTGPVDNPTVEGLHTVLYAEANFFVINARWDTVIDEFANGNVTYADLRKTQVLDDEVIEDQEVFNGAYNDYLNTIYENSPFNGGNYLGDITGQLLLTTNTYNYTPPNPTASAFYNAQFYYNLRVYGGATYEVEWYDMDNNLLDNASFTPANDGIYAVFVGPTSLVAVDYYVLIYNDTDFTSLAYYFTYDNRCTINNQQLIYLDRMGSWQAFAFQLRTYEKGQITREQYNQHIDGTVVNQEWVGVNLQKGFRTYNTNVTKTLDLNTNWMAEYDAKRFQELLTSPQVYYYLIGENPIKFCACVVEATSFEVFSQKNKKLIKQSVTIRLAQQDPING